MYEHLALHHDVHQAASKFTADVGAGVCSWLQQSSAAYNSGSSWLSRYFELLLCAADATYAVLQLDSRCCPTSPSVKF